MDLKQSTVDQVICFGPFVDATDGVTLEVGLVAALDHAVTGIMLSKNGGTLAVRHAAVTASEYDAHGCYKVTLDATDTATLGQLRVIYTDAATCLPVWQDFNVISAGEYASKYGASLPEVNVTEIAGVAVSATTAQLGVNVVQVEGQALAAKVGENFNAIFNNAGIATTKTWDETNHVVEIYQRTHTL